MEDTNPFGPLSALVDYEEEMADSTDKLLEETSLKTQAAANYQGDYHGSDIEHRRRKVSQGRETLIIHQK
jgi:hypothetical protein